MAVSENLRRLVDLSAPYWAGEAEVAWTYFQSPRRNRKSDLIWLARQCYKELWGSGVGDRKKGLFLGPVDYLRKVYPDPMTGSTEWGLIPAPGGQGIMGVYSLSEAAPIKTGNFSMAYEVFHGSSRYSEWQFFYNPEILQYEAR